MLFLIKIEIDLCQSLIDLYHYAVVMPVFAVYSACRCTVVKPEYKKAPFFLRCFLYNN